MTVTWNVEDFKISYKDLYEVTIIISYLKSIYDPMIMKLENKHTYLGMDLDFTEKVKVNI